MNFSRRIKRYYHKVKRKLKKTKKLIPKFFKSISEARVEWQKKDFKQRARYASYYKHKKIKENVVLYEAFYGRGMFCNPYALFLALLEDPRAQHMKHVWVLDDFANHQSLIEEYKKYPNVSFVELYSKDYLKYLCSAKYLINNNTFPTYFTKKEGQIYINTWHGITLKTLGYDMPNGKIAAHNTVRNFLHVDYLISTSPAVTDLMFSKAHKLDGLWTGKVIEEGYPRLDLMFGFTREEVFEKLKNYGVKVDPNKKIILYAPTWRGESHNQVNIDVDQYYKFKENLESLIDTSKYQILIKTHYLVYKSCKDKLTAEFFVPMMIDANMLLSVTDILIADFSSIYIDYLVTDRPVLFYIPDLEEYQEERGLYRTIDQLPGPVTQTISELAVWINNVDNIKTNYCDAYEREKEWAGVTSDANISERVIDAIFFQNEEKYHIRSLQSHTKKKLLISINGLLINGITSSFLNLLHNINYDCYDVSVMVKKSSQQEGNKLIEQIPSEVRVLYRNSTFNMTKWEFLCHKIYENCGYKRYDYPMYRREFVRCYGKSSFDYVIDFAGYTRFYSLLDLQDPYAKTAIWLHNDMYSEYKTKYSYLINEFKIYSHFDYLVSCSKEIMEVNKKKLAKKYHIPSKKFHYAKNCIEQNRSEMAKQGDFLVSFRGKQFISLKEVYEMQSLTTQLVPYYPQKDEEGRQNFRFITIGRMSPEKNQLTLVRAFDRLYSEFPNISLYIVGDGPLRDNMKESINSLPSKNHIIMTGNINNPFVLMKYCDCFILPSLYEGQPLTIMEAREMSLPIIMTDFGSAEGVTMENGQLIIEPTEEGIFNGMKSFILGELTANYDFNVTEYNREAYQEFLTAIGEA